MSANGMGAAPIARAQRRRRLRERGRQLLLHRADLRRARELRAARVGQVVEERRWPGRRCASARRRAAAPSRCHDMYDETPSVATWRGRSLSRASILRGERAARPASRGAASRRRRPAGSRAASCRRVRLGLEQVAVRDDGDERRLEPVRAAHLVVDALERVEVARRSRRRPRSPWRRRRRRPGAWARSSTAIDSSALGASSASAGAEPSCTPRVSRIDIAPPPRS